jgi:hypothetical protein
MAQQEIAPFRLADRLYAAEKRAMRLATHPESPDGTITTPDELLHIQELRDARLELERYGEGTQVAVRMIRLGPDAPSLPRSLHDLYGHDSPDDHEPEGMRR